MMYVRFGSLAVIQAVIKFAYITTKNIGEISITLANVAIISIPTDIKFAAKVYLFKIAPAAAINPAIRQDAAPQIKILDAFTSSMFSSPKNPSWGDVISGYIGEIM